MQTVFHVTCLLRYHCLAVVLASILGCSSGENYQPMTGNVTVDGQPLEKGVITFYPNGPGTTVGGEIIEGQFKLAQEQGATPGKYRVEIVAYRASGKSEFDVDLNTQVPIEIQILPARYNVKSQLEVEVADGGSNEFEFALEGK